MIMLSCLSPIIVYMHCISWLISCCSLLQMQRQVERLLRPSLSLLSRRAASTEAEQRMSAKLQQELQAVSVTVEDISGVWCGVGR